MASPRRKWMVAGVVVVALLALAVTPPLINVNRFQRRIAMSMSASLGRPVHLDSVSLHLLPVPGFRLENLVVSEDPAFGNEPVIRANVVEARLRAGSLWRRRVEFSSLRFEDPSLNLVRTADGRWNVQSLLMRAAAVEAAPTGQRAAGPSPRFPYIEATGARVNVKTGDEKLPFSLTDADFALWLPSPERWRVRLEGKPARTDTSISDPGVLSLEGTLDRPRGTGSDISRIPVDLHATWKKAPLGEASKLVTGEDQNWRGNLTVEAALTGQLDDATLTSTVHVEDMHRADFYPARTLDLQVRCSAQMTVTQGALHDAHCALPVDGREAIAASAPWIDMGTPADSHTDVVLTQVPMEWLIDWTRLWSTRIPVKKLQGSVDGQLAIERHPEGWSTSGSIDMTVPALEPLLPKAEVPTSNLHWTVLPGSGATLLPVSLTAPDGSDVSLSSVVSPQGYQYSVDGTATRETLDSVLAYLPPLGDGLMADASSKAGAASPVDVTCQRLWDQAQSCHAMDRVVVTKGHRRRR